MSKCWTGSPAVRPPARPPCVVRPHGGLHQTDVRFIIGVAAIHLKARRLDVGEL